MSRLAKEKMMRAVFLGTACVSIVSVILICLFLFVNGVPAMAKIGFWNFLAGKTWRPSNRLYGIFPMIVGSVYVTAGALALGVPVGLLTAIFLARFCPQWLYRLIKPSVSLLAGIPSVVYGFFGLVVLVPGIKALFGGKGYSMLAASLLLSMMILPTVISVAEAAIRAVPESYYEGAVALGATHEQGVFFVVVPAARSGIFTGVVLGAGRAIGETMAVIMVAGNQARMPTGILSGLRTLTANIVLEMGYAADLHREALIATAVVLFVLILLINFALQMLKRRVNA